jgi:hypothetical protein
MEDASIWEKHKIISTEIENKVNRGSKVKIHEKEGGKCKQDNREEVTINE